MFFEDWKKNFSICFSFSGCGKSTSVGLITRLYEAEQGKVTIDGNNVNDLNIEWLRNVVGIVQQVRLSIKKNDQVY